ncbi:MAG: SMC-Scp complex subunit ScpB [Bacteroidota bacterium]
MKLLDRHIEALIFAAEQPVSFKEIRNCLDELFQKKYKKKDIEASLAALFEKYKSEEHAFEIREIAEGYQFLTKGEYHDIIGIQIRQKTKKRLTRAALETLSIIAYKQPVTKTDIEHIRGVNCDYSINKLLEKELIHIAGRSESPGRPLLYTTSAKFMDYFGLRSIKDLPKLKDLSSAENEVGQPAPIEEQSLTGLEALAEAVDQEEE